jgi:uncharacterized membrane protein (UPF0127 family)
MSAAVRASTAWPMALLLLAACHKGAWPVHTITVDGAPIRVEVAHTAEQRRVGLMNRDQLPADEGMLFIYPAEANRSFWMKSTRIPLDIAFAGDDGVIFRIAQMVPFSTSSTPSLQPARYALEMNEGWFAAHEVVVGDVIGSIPDLIAEP